MDAIADPASGCADAGFLIPPASPNVLLSAPPRFRALWSRAALATCGVFSLSLHAAALAAFMTWDRNELGVLAQPTEAISIELFASPVLEQALVDVRETASGAASSVAQEAGSDSDSAAHAVTEVEDLEVVKAETAPEAVQELAPAERPVEIETTDTVISGTAEADETLPQPAVAPEKPRIEDKAKPAKPRREKAAARPPDTKPEPSETKPSKKGGAPSRSSASNAAGSGRVSASAGDVAGYAARVRARVASNRPSARGARGTAVVSFGVSRSGGLSYVRLGRSSGSPALDQAALSAVRRAAPFPPPPAGAPASKLGFSVPFYFR